MKVDIVTVVAIINILLFVYIITTLTRPEQIEKKPSIPSFASDIAINDTDNGMLIKFLNNNVDSVIFINLHIDASESLQEHLNIINSCDIKPDDITNARVITLPTLDGKDIWCGYGIELVLREGETLPMSYGGTGIARALLRGFFSVSEHYYSGPRHIYRLEKLQPGVNQLHNYLLNSKQSANE